MEKYHFHNPGWGGEYIIQRNGFIQRKLPLSSATIFTVAQSVDGGMSTRKAPATTPSKLFSPKPLQGFPLVKTASTPPGETLLQPL